MASARAQSAREVLDVVPMVMRFIRAQMREYGAVELSVPQFRSLLFIKRHADSPLGSVAEHLGLTPPSTTKLVDCLERRALVQRKASSADRRKISLGLTARGNALLDKATKGTQASLVEALADLEAPELKAIGVAMAALRRVFSATSRDEG